MQTTTCPECGAAWADGQACQEYFHQMLFWENEDPVNGEVHHLMVLAYHLQHPSLYAPDGLKAAKGLLVDFLEKGLTTEDVRKRDRDVVDSGKRGWKIKATATSQGSYDHPVTWTMTAGDVVAAGIAKYRESVRAWAQSIYEALKESGNLG